MKTKYLSLILLLTISSIINAQTYQWARNGGSQGIEDPRLICTDNNDNVYVVGYYEYLGEPPYTVSTFAVFAPDTVPIRGYSDILLVKYSPTGDVLWAKSIGGNDPSFYETMEQPTSIIYNNITNSIVLTGVYRNTIILGNDTLEVTGNKSTFIAMISQNGVILHAKKQLNWASVKTVDGNGNAYVTTPDNIIVLDTSFNITDTLTNCHNCYIENMSIENNKMYLLCAAVTDTVTVDSTAYIAGEGNYFIAKMDFQMNLDWIRFIKSAGTIIFPEMITNEEEKIVVAGVFTSGSLYIDTLHFTSPTTQELFMVSFDSIGTIRWTMTGETSDLTGEYDFINLALLPDNDFYLGGIYYYGTQMKLCENTVTGNTSFVARFGMDGNCNGLFNGIFALDLCTDSESSIIITKSANASMLSSFGLTSYGSSDILVVKYDSLFVKDELKMMPINELVIFANPNAGKCRVTIPYEFKTEKNLTLQILDNNGKLMQQIPVEMQQESISINISAEAKGIYNAILTNGKKAYRGKIVFE